MTADEFAAKWGRAPQQDDLERVNCGDGGAIGHFFCGVCPGCDRPRFSCVCRIVEQIGMVASYLSAAHLDNGYDPDHLQTKRIELGLLCRTYTELRQKL